MAADVAVADCRPGLGRCRMDRTPTERGDARTL
jgi:hypothetical protein